MIRKTFKMLILTGAQDFVEPVKVTGNRVIMRQAVLHHDRQVENQDHDQLSAGDVFRFFIGISHSG